MSSRTSTADTTILRMTRLVRSNPLLCRFCPCRANTRERFSGSASAASESCLQDLEAQPCGILRGSIAWITTAISHLRRPLACFAQVPKTRRVW